MADTFKLVILSPERRLVEGANVEYLTLTSSEGQIQILPGHAHIMSTLDTGYFSYRVPGEEETSGAISGGFYQVTDGVVTVMAETLELLHEIDVPRARKAQAEAEQALKEAELEPRHFLEYQAQLRRAVARQAVAAKEH